MKQCDPAPFYLFDEIDAALDTQYRSAVACKYFINYTAMVHSLSKDAQFIVTTFRPEMLIHADRFFGVTFLQKVSKVQNISRQDATQFVDGQVQ